jgi:hypothetical protein
MTKPVHTISELFEKNKLYMMEYEHSMLMQLIHSDKVNDVAARTEILDCIQTFSNYFQKAVMLRYVTTEHRPASLIAANHLDEEFKHNETLSKDRGHRPPKWDPILEATSSWFAWKMLTLDNIEKTVLMHLILETSADIFFRAADKVMQKFGETKYFAIHADVDEHHAAMGEKLLLNLSEAEYIRLGEILNFGWTMLTVACNRIATLAQGKEEALHQSKKISTSQTARL